MAADNISDDTTWIGPRIPGAPLTAEQLETAEPGLYRTTQREVRTVVSIVTMTQFTGECVLIARVMEGSGCFPYAAEVVRVRPDGKWIIFQWVAPAWIE